MASVQLVERRPSVEEYCRLISAVGWKPRDVEAVSRALGASIFAICAETNGGVIGMGRVIGDGGPHYYLKEVGGATAPQQPGISSAISSAPTKQSESIPFKTH